MEHTEFMYEKPVMLNVSCHAASGGCSVCCLQWDSAMLSGAFVVSFNPSCPQECNGGAASGDCVSQLLAPLWGHLWCPSDHRLIIEV